MVLLTQDEVFDGMISVMDGELGRLVDGEELAAQMVLAGRLLNVMHLNIRSISKNFDGLLLLIQSFKLFDCDVIILSECFQITSVDQYNIPGYSAFYNEGITIEMMVL